MDIIFKCPNCEQELEVDASGAGSIIECPSCSKSLTVPEPEPVEEDAEEETPAPPRGVKPVPPPPPPPQEEKHFKVPTTVERSDVLIVKPNKPLEIAAKESDRKIRIKTFKRSDCQEVGRDHFDENVSAFLDRVGQSNIVSINSINYSVVDMGSHQVLTDYGVLIVYKG
jgi:DNA-directed RNA polymerase subunit RPC12/RpoP